MPDQFSIADARAHLPRLVTRAEKGKPVEITRRGKPVAVLVSAAEYERMTAKKPSLWESIVDFRRRYDVDENGLDAHEMRGLRDRSPGRKVRW